ncbi:MAG: J domain-containing protein [Flavobacteriales bacterium]|nr:J domain-containing protein [Flavobacteriales bacterium]
MQERNLYSILNLPDFSDIDRVKRTFRILALEHHPDKNPSPESAEKFKLFLSAYEILGEAESKAKYDQQLKTGNVFVRFDSIPHQKSPEDLRKERVASYLKLKKEQDARIEVENLRKYENSLDAKPFLLRIWFGSGILATAVVLFMNDWFKHGPLIALGSFMLIFGLMYIWNEYYKHYWYEQLTDKNIERSKINYDRLSRIVSSRYLLIWILATVLILNGKKAYHLSTFGETIEAEIMADQRMIKYVYKGVEYQNSLYFIPEGISGTTHIYIQVSSKEPEIWEYLD